MHYIASTALVHRKSAALARGQRRGFVLRHFGVEVHDAAPSRDADHAAATSFVDQYDT